MKIKNIDHTSQPLEVQALCERIRKLEGEKERLRSELWNFRKKQSAIACYILLSCGVATVVSSVFFVSSVLAFIGLTLALWGGLLLFIKSEKYVKLSVLDSVTISLLTAIDRIISDLNYEGEAIYLPPLPYYLKGYKGGMVFIGSKKETALPAVQEVARKRAFVENPKGICIVPPGLELVNLYEGKLGEEFTEVDLQFIQNQLPKLLVEGLEMADDVEMTLQDRMIRIRITGSIYNDLCGEARKLPNICKLGCPLCSSIACALTRSAGRPVIIEKNRFSSDGNEIETFYRVFEE